MRWPGRKKEDLDKYSIDELVLTGRYDHARELLEKRIRLNPRDYQQQVKLAEVLTASGDRDSGIRLYIRAADSYSSDGFHDKALAVLGRAHKEFPDEPRIEGALRRAHAAKQMEVRRHKVVEALSSSERGEAGLNVVQARQAWKALLDAGLTRDLQADDLGRLAAAVRLEWLERGDVLVEQGEEEPRLFIVLEGEIESFFEHGETSHPVAHYQPGSVVGETSLFDEEPWQARFSARRASRVMILDKDALAAAMTGCSNPRALLDNLRKQANDGSVSAAVYRILHADSSDPADPSTLAETSEPPPEP